MATSNVSPLIINSFVSLPNKEYEVSLIGINDLLSSSLNSNFFYFRIKSGLSMKKLSSIASLVIASSIFSLFGLK